MEGKNWWKGEEKLDNKDYVEKEYNPANVEHVPNQQGVVIDEEKARELAEVEKYSHSFASLYPQYLATEGEDEKVQAFIEEHKNQLADIGGVWGGMQTLEWARVNNVTAEWILRFGEMEFEVVGELYDFKRHTLPALTDQELNSLRGKLWETDDALKRNIAQYPKRISDTTQILNQKLSPQLNWEKMSQIDQELHRRQEERDTLSYRFMQFIAKLKGEA